MTSWLVSCLDTWNDAHICYISFNIAYASQETCFQFIWDTCSAARPPKSLHASPVCFMPSSWNVNHNTYRMTAGESMRTHMHIACTSWETYIFLWIYQDDHCLHIMGELFHPICEIYPHAYCLYVMGDLFLPICESLWFWMCAETGT